MKKVIILFCLLPGLLYSQPAPVLEATTNQVVAGTLGYPFMVTPRGLAGAGFTPGGGGGGGTVTAGTNIVVDSSAGANTVSLKDPAIVGQINTTILWVTNMVSPTNLFAGTVADVSRTEDGTTNLGGNLTFTGVSGITQGGVNGTIIRLKSGGSTRTIDVADASMHKVTNWNTTLPAGWSMEVMVRVYPGDQTNFSQNIYP